MKPVVNKVKTFFEVTLIIIFFMYLSFLFYLTFFSRFYGREYFHRRMNLIPFGTISQYLSANFSSKIVVTNLLGNIAAFVPMGFLLPLVLKKSISFLKAVMFCAVVSIAIEMTQYAFGVGAADVDDLILNLTGGLLGYAVFTLIRVIYRKTLKR